MPDVVDMKLATALKTAKAGAEMFFAFVAKSATEGALVVSKKNISAKEIGDAKAKCGGKTVFKGSCVGEDGKLVFNLAVKPPGTLAAQLKTVIQTSTPMSGVTVVTRMVAKIEGMETDASDASDAPSDPAQQSTPSQASAPEAPAPEPPSAEPDLPPPPPPPPDWSVTFMTRYKALATPMRLADATKRPEVQAIRAKFGEANTFFRNKDYDQANAALNQAEALIKQVLAAAKAAGAADLAPPPAQYSANEVNAFSARLKTLLPQLQEAEAAHPAQVQAAKVKFGEANALFRTKKFADANSLLDQAESLVKQALATGTAPAPQAGSGLEAQWESRIVALEPRVLEAKKTRPHDAKWMTMFMSAQDLGGAGDFAKALKVLDQLQQLLDAPPTDAAVNLAGWQTARGGAIGALRGLAAEVQQEEDDPDKKEALVLIESIIKNLTEKPVTSQQVVALQTYLQTDPVVADACMAINIRDPLLNALTELKSNIAA